MGTLVPRLRVKVPPRPSPPPSSSERTSPMTSNFLNDPLLHAIERDLDRLLSSSSTLKSSTRRTSQPSQPAPPVDTFLSDVPTQPLSWLWPG
ncbi:MAG: hypothetical protein M3Z24_11755, partial [Chloroflexota bacterium]|nr:hypothetical protein [Chloroflexota bacterium]